MTQTEIKFSAQFLFCMMEIDKSEQVHQEVQADLNVKAPNLKTDLNEEMHYGLHYESSDIGA